MDTIPDLFNKCHDGHLIYLRIDRIADFLDYASRFNMTVQIMPLTHGSFQIERVVFANND